MCWTGAERARRNAICKAIGSANENSLRCRSRRHSRSQGSKLLRLVWRCGTALRQNAGCGRTDWPACSDCAGQIPPCSAGNGRYAGARCGVTRSADGKCRCCDPLRRFQSGGQATGWLAAEPAATPAAVPRDLIAATAFPVLPGEPKAQTAGDNRDRCRAVPAVPVADVRLESSAGAE